MGLFEDAEVTLLLADYVAPDAANKLNALGIGFQATVVGDNGLSAPMYIGALFEAPSQYAGQSFSLCLELRDLRANEPVKAPTQSGSSERAAIRAQQVVMFEQPRLGAIVMPPEIRARVQVALAFPGGVPVTAGGVYVWRAEINGAWKPHWEVPFWVRGSELLMG